MSTATQQTLQLSAKKLALLAALRQQEGLANIPDAAISRRPADEPLVLSFTQERLWFLEQMEPGRSVYSMPWALRLRGSLLNHAALQQAVEAIVMRHEVLRTTFATRNGRPHPIIHAAIKVNIPQIDLKNWEAAQEQIAQEAQSPFDLENGPLLRAKLLRLSPADHVLLLNMHHIVADGWSIEVLIKELMALYAAFSNGRSNPLPPLPIQHSDYAWWQRQQLQGETLQTQLDFWQAELADSPPLLALPTDRPRPQQQTYRGAAEPVSLSKSVSEALKRLSQEEGVTLFMTLLAAFKVLLYRYTNQSDILVGTPVTNRSHPATETLIGPLFNTLVLRSDLSGAPTFRTLLQHVRQGALAAYAHQDVPFEKIVDALQLERSLSHSPLFQVMCVLHHAPAVGLKLPGLQLDSLDAPTRTAKFDLTLAVMDMPQGLTGELEYRSDLFDAATIKRMWGHFETLVANIVADPDQSIDDLALITAVERNTLLNMGQTNPPQLPSPPPRYPQLFEAQVAQTPETTALQLGAERLTYRELNQQANQLAHHLRTLGVEQGSCVAVCLERSLQSAISLLAILKAGGVYCPLDPAYPAERLAFMLADTQASTLLTQQSLLDNNQFPVPNEQLTIIPLDTHWPKQQETTNPAPLITAANLATIIYTSGSSGKPKGVLVSHDALARHCTAMKAYYELKPEDKVLQFASFSFDASLEQLLPPLLSGAEIILRDSDVPTISTFCQQMIEWGLTVVNLPTAYWQQLTQNWDAVTSWLAEGQLRLLIVGGEAMSPTQLQQWRSANLQGIRLLNAYGPTETTVTALVYDVSSLLKLESESAQPDRVPIGRPLPGRHVYILDKQGQPVPVGISGELHIGGDCVAEGYLNRPKLTAEKFIDLRSNRQSKIENRKSYKTGDLARFLPDGNVEFIGRVDQQVKVRGFRIELGEIEAALQTHVAVQEAIVTVREASNDDKRLVAYLVGDQANNPTPDQLRTHCQQTLPDYMLPSAFVWLETIPHTATGKADRRALPAPGREHTNLSSQFVAPRDALELQLIQIWEDILNVHPIGIGDNFFNVGGHSLLAVQLMSKIEKIMGRTLPLSTLFGNGTVAQLATLLRQEPDEGQHSPLITIQPNGNKTPFFGVHPAGGTVLCYLDLARNLGRDQPFYALEAPGLNGEQSPFTNIHEMAALYVTAVRAAHPEGPYYLGGWCFGGTIAFEMAHQLQQQGQTVAKLILIDTYAPVVVETAVADAAEEVEMDDATLYTLFAKGLGGHFGKDVPIAAEDLQGLSQSKMVDEVLQRLQQAGALPADAGAEQLQRYLDVYMSNSEALFAYKPTVYTHPVTLLKAVDEPIHQYYNETLGWARYVADPIQIYDVPGEHASMIFEPHVQGLAEKLTQLLGEK